MSLETAETLPLGYIYDGYISREQYDSLTYIQRQQALTQGLLCDAIPAGSEAAELHFQDSSLPYEISCSEDVLEMNGSFYAAAPGAQLTLTFSSPADCETYLLIQGMQAESLNELELYTTEPFSLLPDFSWSSLSRYEQNRIRRDARHSPVAARFTLNCRSEYVDTDFSYYASLTESSFDRTDFLINLGYSEEGQTQAVLTLPYAGIYSFSSLEVLSLSHEPPGRADRCFKPGNSGKYNLWNQSDYRNHQPVPGQAALPLHSLVLRLEAPCRWTGSRALPGKYHVHGRRPDRRQSYH